jgi:hypothetical protein
LVAHGKGGWTTGGCLEILWMALTDVFSLDVLCQCIHENVGCWRSQQTMLTNIALPSTFMQWSGQDNYNRVQWDQFTYGVATSRLNLI